MSEPKPLQPSDQQRIARVDVVGANKDLWRSLRPKLLQMVNAVLNTTIDHDKNTTIAEEAKKLTSQMLEHVRRRLQREGLENDKIEAEIATLYAERTEKLANAEKASAEAAAIRQRSALQKLVEVLCLTEAMLVGDESEEAILFGRQIKTFRDLVKEMNLLAES
ncbi:MAG: hypothetical protein RBS39_00110 [Phycisphaerales bacterium]|jgi:hypothetical protein|nr:hypothetical protein [Phycisphaerales bacterium]